MLREELDRSLVTILNEHRHEQIDTETAMRQVKQLFVLYFEGAVPGRIVKELGIKAKCTCQGFKRNPKCPVHGTTVLKHSAKSGQYE